MRRTGRALWITLACLLSYLAVPSRSPAQTPETISSVRSEKHKTLCASCHSIHGGASILLSAVGNALCDQCHAAGAPGTAPKVVTHRNGSSSSKIPFDLACLDCHNPHYYLKNKRGALGRLAEDPATSVEQPCQDGNPTNNIPFSGTNSVPPSDTVGRCANFSLLSNVRDDTNGARLRFKIKSVLQNTTSQSGLGSYNADRTVDGYTVDMAWTTNGSTAGAWLRADLGSGKAKEFLETRIYALAPAYSGIYSVQYSDNAINWLDAVTGFAPTLLGWNTAKWAQGVGAHRYWRLLLTNTPGTSAGLSEWEFYGPTDCTNTGGTPKFDGASFYLSCERTHVAGRYEPLRVGSGQSAVTYNDWASVASPYQGVCNVCHTRTQHHRNNNTLDPSDPFYTDPDHDHNVTRRCTDCHDHSNSSGGFSKNQ